MLIAGGAETRGRSGAGVRRLATSRAPAPRVYFEERLVLRSQRYQLLIAVNQVHLENPVVRDRETILRVLSLRHHP